MTREELQALKPGDAVWYVGTVTTYGPGLEVHESKPMPKRANVRKILYHVEGARRGEVKCVDIETRGLSMSDYNVDRFMATRWLTREEAQASMALPGQVSP